MTSHESNNRPVTVCDLTTVLLRECLLVLLVPVCIIPRPRQSRCAERGRDKDESRGHHGVDVPRPASVQVAGEALSLQDTGEEGEVEVCEQHSPYKTLEKKVR